MTDRLWLTDHISGLALTFGIALDPPERLKVYVDVLCDLDQDALAQAIERAVRECKFFPSIAELRELAGADAQQQAECEASEMWVKLERFVRRNYYADLGGLQHSDKLPARVAWALRQIGGAQALANRTVENEPFLRKDFIAAYNNFPVYEQMRPQLESAWPAEISRQLPAATGAKPALPAPAPAAQPRCRTTAPAARALKPIPRPMSDAELRARRNLLAQQARDLLAQEPAQPQGAAEMASSAGCCESRCPQPA